MNHTVVGFGLLVAMGGAKVPSGPADPLLVCMTSAAGVVLLSDSLGCGVVVVPDGGHTGQEGWAGGQTVVRFFSASRSPRSCRTVVCLTGPRYFDHERDIILV